MSHSPTPVGLRGTVRYLPQLEALRGWAILLVVAFHALGFIDGAASENGLSADSPFWLRIVGAGNTGVTLFFVLSGFLLAQPFIQAIRSGEKVSIGRFYSARLLRIVPLYYAVVLVAWLVSSNSAGALKALLFIPVGFEIFPFSVPWWTLCVEMQFYFLLPWVMLILSYRLGRHLVVLIGAGWLIWHCIYLLLPQLLGSLYIPGIADSLFGRGFAFLIGGLAGWLYISRGYAVIFRSARFVGSASLLLLVAMLWLLQWYGLVGQAPALQAMPLYHDLEALLWAGLLLCSLGPPSGLRRIFINRLFSHFGSISYSLYLVHLPIFFYLIYPAKVAAGGAFTVFDLRMLVAVGGSFLLSWLLAVLCYRLIEKPFLGLKSHLPVFIDKRRGGLASQS
jgi:peptidoglycan/LPS O-acetylase OafA/YrhL